MTGKLHIGLAGLGTVGGGVLRVLAENGEIIAARANKKLEVVAVSARDKGKQREHLPANVTWHDNVMDMATNQEVDVVVEMIGGSEGIAKELVEAALKNGKAVVTANKALIAHHGLALAALAEENGAMLAYEAAVAGGIPVIKTFRDGLAANRFSRVIGILNGTSNFILSAMWQHRKAFEDVLREAQLLGYAEAEPSFDVDGIDAAHKLSILSSLAFGCAPEMEAIYVEGIRRIDVRDLEFASKLGYCIKLLGIASRTESGIQQRVHPAMIRKTSPMANVHDVYNAVVAEGDAVGKMFIEGRGAGAGPTASSVVADIIDVARGVYYCPFTLPVAQLSRAAFAPMEDLQTAYYMRLAVSDKPGVLAAVTKIFSEHGISVDSVLQQAQQAGEAVQVVMTTHVTGEAAMMKALEKIGGLPELKEKPYLIRIEEL